MRRLLKLFAISIVLVGCGSVTGDPQEDGGAGTGGAANTGGAGTGGHNGGAGGTKAAGGATGGAQQTGTGGDGTGGIHGTGGSTSQTGGGGGGGAAATGGTSGMTFPTCTSLGWTFTGATGCTNISTGQQAWYGALPCLQGCVNTTGGYYATQDCTDKSVDPGANSLCVVDCSICK